MDKLNFYFDQMVDETDLDAIQTSADDADKNLAKDIMGSGIISGLDILPNSPADLTVRYSHGVAYDAYGQRIEVPGDGTKDCSSYVVGTDGNERWLTIVAKFARNNYDQRLDGNGNQILYKNDEYFEIAILAGDVALIGSAVKPVPAVGEVVMADVRLYYGQTAINTVDINEARRVVQQNLSGHTGDKNNPHDVTTAQIGAVAQTDFDTHLTAAFEADKVTVKNATHAVSADSAANVNKYTTTVTVENNAIATITHNLNINNPIVVIYVSSAGYYSVPNYSKYSITDANNIALRNIEGSTATFLVQVLKI